MKHIGQLIQQRREAMNLTMSALSREMGGYPSPSLMSRIEDGTVDLTANSASKYAEALRLDKDTMLNAAGFATPAQHVGALGELARTLGEDVPVMAAIPVVDPEYPDLMLSATTRTRELKKAEDVFIVDLMGKQHEPYIGEVLASRARKPKEGQGVVAEVSGKLGAWTYHTSRTTGDWLENGAGEKATRYRLWGVIIRWTPTYEIKE